MHIFFEGLSCLALLRLPAAFDGAECGGVEGGDLPGHPGAARRRQGCTWPTPPAPAAAAS